MKRAGLLLAAAAVVVAAGGWALAATWHLSTGTGLYCSLGTATTVGCNPGLSTAGKVAAVAVMLLAIPLLAAVFSLLTGQHAGRRAAERVREHIVATEKRITEQAAEHHKALREQFAAHCTDIKQHVNAVVADGPGKGGAGSNPASSEGLPAEAAAAAPPAAGPVVPPPATRTPLPLIKVEPKTSGRRKPRGAA